MSAAVVAPRFDRAASAGGNHEDVDREEFPEFLAVAILSWMAHFLAQAKRKAVGSDDAEEVLTFLPLFNFSHKDGVDMVTVGGVVVDKAVLPLWKDKVAEGIVWSTIDPGLPTHERLDLIPLTIKEKVALDRCLPWEQPDFLAGAKADGLQISDEHLSKYWRYYRQFPMFFETSL